jgi:hypothetical protein
VLILVESLRQPVMKVESYDNSDLSRIAKWNRTRELRFTKILRYVPARRIGALFRLDPKVRGRKRGLYEIFM